MGVGEVDPAQDLFGNTMKRQTDRTKLCLEELVARLVGHKFKLPEGFADWIDCEVKLFGTPGTDKAGIDVVFSDGGHLEIHLTRTGWGSPVARPYGPGKEPYRGL
jgi:hypothetical protein